MATKTRAEMITKTLQRLGVLGAGQTATSEDSDIVGDALDAIHSEFQARSLAPFASSAFPEWSWEPFAMLIGADVAPYFGLPSNQGDIIMAEARLTEQLRTRKTGLPVRFKAF